MTDDTLPPMQACRKCGEDKPHTDEFYHRMSDGRGGKPLQRICRTCRNAANREYQNKRWAEHHERLLARNRAYAQRNAERVREWEAARPCRAEYNAAQKKRDWATLTEEDRLARYEKLKQWKRENPDKVAAVTKRTYEKHKAERDAYRRQWRIDNPEATAAARDRRRARAAGAEGSYTKDDVRHLLSTQGRVCRYCSGQLTKFHVDHFIPLSRGGSNWPSNLVLSCPPCNWSKAGKMPWDFRPDLFSAP